MAHRLEGDGDAGQIEVVLAETGHRLEIEVLPVDKWNLSVVAVVDLQFAGVVVTRKTELLKLRNDRVVDDLDDVGLLLEGAHAVVQTPVPTLGNGTVLLLPGADDVGKIELHLHARAVLDKRNAVTVADLAAHCGKTDRELGVTLDARPVGIPLDDLHIPHPPDEQEHRGGDDAGDERDFPEGIVGLHRSTWASETHALWFRRRLGIGSHRDKRAQQ